MSNSIQKGYSSIYELPSEVRASFDETDQKKWLDNYSKFLGDGNSEQEIEDAKFKAWKSMVDAPSSLAVESWASTEIRDADGELVPIETIEENMEQFIRNGGTVHDSHSNVVIGNIWGWEKRHNEEYDEDGIVVYFNINHDGEVAERARDDILSGRKNSMSIGAEAPRGGYKCDDRGCYVERDVTDLYEISICETPANQSAVFINVGKDIAKAKQPLAGEKIRFNVKDVVVHQDYTTCPLQKCKKVLRDKGYKNIHISNDGKVLAKSINNEYRLFKAISKLGYPFRYDLQKQQFEIIPDYGVEQAIEEALGNGWAHEDNIGHIALTRNVPKEVFIDWFDRGFIVKIGDNYCLKGDDVAKDSVRKSASTDEYIEKIDGMLSSLLGQINYDYPSSAGAFDKDIERMKEILFDMKDALTYADAGLLQSAKKKVKKDAGAMGVGDAGATNAVYGKKPKSLVSTENPDKFFGRRKKTKKEMVDDGNIHGPAPSTTARKSKINKWVDVLTEEFVKMLKETINEHELYKEFGKNSYDELTEEEIDKLIEELNKNLFGTNIED